MATRKQQNPRAPLIVWLRYDLRLQDNPALAAGLASGSPLVVLYILDEASPAMFTLGVDWSTGAASRWWLHHSLAALQRSLQDCGAQLSLRRGDAACIVPDIVEATAATTVYWNRGYEPWLVERDKRIKTQLREGGTAVTSFKANLLVEPWELETGAGKPYRVFTPFWKSMLAAGVKPLEHPAPERINSLNDIPSDDLDDWGLLPGAPDWAAGFHDHWRPGEAGAHERLTRFSTEVLGNYDNGRDLPAEELTSGLSPHLHFGEISPATIWRHALRAAGRSTKRKDDAMAYLRQIAWREFCHSLLYHFPAMAAENFNPRFDNFKWRDDPAALAAWQQGQTGYPVVDAGMRQLWHTGWMHNRVRMIAASFLVKDLLVHWREGERWFRDTLVDADLANNVAGWQWVAGSGADAAPYFRVFNPVSQGEKFDPDGRYVRHWVPEIAALPDRYIHRPWSAPKDVLDSAGIRPGTTYPEPIVSHSSARMRALAAYEKIKS